MFVELPGRMGVGKLESVADGHFAISIFHSIRRTEIVKLKIDEIQRGYLSPQTRVYVQGSERVEVGRVTDYLRQENGLIDYEVHFPNGKQRDYNELDLFVRPWTSSEDPAETLAAGGAESQFLHDRRQRAVELLLGLRSASQGLTSLISAGIDFVPHQISAVRRVLSDPIQRYLLADEVGLGKTIEAGLIIRQHLIDHPESQVLIATPPQLCDQWRSELVKKLRLDQFGEAFECCTHRDLARVSRAPDVLVVDEAHHLVGLESGSLLRAAKQLYEIAHEVPVLLLLSATPPLGEETKMLALLNLLDPSTHPLDDIDGFRAKAKQRRQMGRLLLSLDPYAPGIVLRKRGVELQRLFPDDPVVLKFAPQLVATSHQGPDVVANVCSTLKEHIADNYRIHQRVIRSRRADAKGWEFMPRGPTTEGEHNLRHVLCETDPDEQLIPLVAALEDWRFSALESADGDETLISRAAVRYRELLSAVALGVTALRVWLTAARPNFDGEDEFFEALSSINEERKEEVVLRIETMVESTRRLIRILKGSVQNPKVVAFASLTTTASAFYEECIEKSDNFTAHLLTVDNVKDSAEILTVFTDSFQCAILITDRSGEEGVNLGFADAIVHLDLPMSVGQVEQRIGRLDRFGRRKGTIRQRILLPSDDDISPWAAWFELLAHGFLIFNHSISDIQFLLKDLEEQAFQTLLCNGPAGLIDFAVDIRARIADERQSQDEQYALDQIMHRDESVESYIQALEDAEEDEEALGCDVERWLVDALQLKKRPFAWPQQDPFKLIVTNRTLIPRIPWQLEFGPNDNRPLTWKRRIATNNSDVELLRPGTPLIDVADRFARWDDRGTAFITYRSAPNWNGELWIGFKLCFVVEPSCEVSSLFAPTRAELAATRRAQRYLAPHVHTLYLDVNGEPVNDATLRTILERPYRTSEESAFPFDINLGSQPDIFAQIIDSSAFEQICRSLRDGARDRLAAAPKFTGKIYDGVRLAEAELQRIRNRLTRRQSAGDALARAEIELIETILPSIQKPTIRLDAMGCFVVSQHAPERRIHG